MLILLPSHILFSITSLGYVTEQKFLVDYLLGFIFFRLPLFVLSLQLTVRTVNQRSNKKKYLKQQKMVPAKEIKPLQNVN
jgi:hypothetical protein